MLSNLEQHFTVESLHHEIPHEEEDDSSSSDESSYGDHPDQDDSLDLPWNDEEVHGRSSVYIFMFIVNLYIVLRMSF